MTSEVVVLNRAGVALAADSAITIGRKRVWKSSNKLFHRSSNSDVAVMFYGNGDYCGIPIEVILKEFRKSLGKRSLEKLTDYCDKFQEFLPKIDVRDSAISRNILHLICLKVIAECLPREQNLKVREKREQLSRNCAELISVAEQDLNEIFDDAKLQDFTKSYHADIEELLKDEATFKPTKKNISDVIKACFTLLTRDYSSDLMTGIVFAGFGEKELFPVMAALCLDGCVHGLPRLYAFKHIDMNQSLDAPSFVYSFAQSDMTATFMEGTSPNTVKWVLDVLRLTLDQKTEELIKAYVPEENKLVEREIQAKLNESVNEEFERVFRDFRLSGNSDEMLKVISSLPKEEMAAMAEALVEITSLRRKMDSTLESVGGPVDVAIVSKSDGFIWKKRKHYFDIDINRDFLQRRSERFSGRGDESES